MTNKADKINMDYEILQSSTEGFRRNYEDFFRNGLKNENTKRAHTRAVSNFCHWLDERKIKNFDEIDKKIVMEYVDMLQKRLSTATVLSSISAIRALFQWMISKDVMTMDPTMTVRIRRIQPLVIKTESLDEDDITKLINSIETTTAIGLRDRALIATIAFTFAPIGNILRLKVEDLSEINEKLFIRIQNKTNDTNEIQCHKNLGKIFREYMVILRKNGTTYSPVFPTIKKGTREFSNTPMAQSNVHVMIRRRALVAGIRHDISARMFRVTGIRKFLSNGGDLRSASMMAGHVSVKTTKLYDETSRKINEEDISRVIYKV